MKNVINTYGYYLTEDSETIEYRGNFEQNSMFMTTKNPDEQLIYKVFVSPKKTINFAIKIVGGSNPQVVYIPQHIYKDLQIAYNEDNPYYTIKDVTVISLDFTDTGNALIKYLTEKFEKLNDGVSKISSAGVSTIANYAGFNSSGIPVDEDILKQILFLFDEQNDVIFVEKDDVLVTESIANSKLLESNRIKGDFTYTSNYFDSNGVFNSELLNSEANIKLESSTFSSVLQLNDFIKDFSGKSLEETNKIYKNNIVTDTLISQAPKVLGLAIGGLQKAVPLVKGLKDKVSQLNAQRGVKQLEEAKSLGISSINDARGRLSGARDAASGAIGNAGDALSGARDMASGAISDARGQAASAVGSVKDIVKKPVIPQLSNKVPDKAKVKPVSNEYNAIVQELTERDIQERAARLAGLEYNGDYDEDAAGNRIYDDPTENSAYQSALARVKQRESGESNIFGIPSVGAVSNQFNIPSVGGVSNQFNIPSAGAVSNQFNIPSVGGVSNQFNIPSAGALSNRFNIPSVGGVSNQFSLQSVGATSNQFSLPSARGLSNQFTLPNISGLSNKISIP